LLIFEVKNCGQSRSVSFPTSQIITHQSTTFDAAMMASVAAGVYSDHGEAISAMSSIERSFEPNESATAIYKAAYRTYLGAAGQMGSMR